MDEGGQDEMGTGKKRGNEIRLGFRFMFSGGTVGLEL